MLWVDYGKGYGLINSDGRILIGPRFDNVVPYEDYSYVGKPVIFNGALVGGRVGKVDSTGKIVVDPATNSIRFSPVKFN
ncbi:WG repeat-containing protein [bacterium]|nr:MAG: WG repeat-containing protein [bacterium]